MDTAPRLPRGRLCVGDSGIPIQPPPLRGTSFHRKEGMTTRAPSFGRGCRAQRGGVGFLFFCGEVASSLPSPLGKGDRASGARVLSLTAYLRRSFPIFFHTASPIHPPPLRGTSFHRKEGVSTRAPFFGRGCRAQRGGVGFLFCGQAASSLPSPCRESGVILVPSSTNSLALTRASQRGAGSILRLFDRHAFSGGNPLHLFSNVLPHRRRGQDRPAKGIPLCGYSL